MEYEPPTGDRSSIEDAHLTLGGLIDNLGIHSALYPEQQFPMNKQAVDELLSLIGTLFNIPAAMREKAIAALREELTTSGGDFTLEQREALLALLDRMPQ